MEIIANLIEAHIFRVKKDKMEYLLLKRAEHEFYPGLWQMVNGKIKKNEKAYETALREIKEETGLQPDKLWVIPNINQFYSHESDKIIMLPVFAANVNPDSKVKISNEHSDFKWVSPEEAIKLLPWPGQRNSVEIINNYFLNEKHFLNFVEINIL